MFSTFNVYDLRKYYTPINTYVPDGRNEPIGLGSMEEMDHRLCIGRVMPPFTRRPLNSSPSSTTWGRI